MKINYKGELVQMPDFIIVGAAKSGTTSLYEYLKSNKQIFFPNIKESHFFSFFNNNPNFISPENLPTVVSSIKKYSGLFDKAKKEQLLGDASQSYLYKHDTVINSIQEIYGEKARSIKIIIILRNPIERAWSQYWHFKKNFNEPLDFLAAANKDTINKRLQNNWNIFYDYIGFGMYSNQIKSFEANFDNVKVILYDDLKKSSEGVLNIICDFLGISFLNNFPEKRNFNPSGKPKMNLYGFLWKVNVSKKQIRPLKMILPSGLRKSLKNKLMEKALEKKFMDDNEENYLHSIYKEEIKLLFEHTKREEIKKWLK